MSEEKSIIKMKRRISVTNTGSHVIVLPRDWARSIATKDLSLEILESGDILLKPMRNRISADVAEAVRKAAIR